MDGHAARSVEALHCKGCPKEAQRPVEHKRHRGQEAFASTMHLSFDEPGRFVCVPGYEWSGNTGMGGDRNVFFRREGRPIRRSSRILVEGLEHGRGDCYTAKDLFGALAGEDAVVIAHVGGRYADIKYAHDGRLERAVEVHSSWGTFEWLLHDAFEQGHRVGVVCHSDDHKGRQGATYPGASTFGASTFGTWAGGTAAICGAGAAGAGDTAFGAGSAAGSAACVAEICANAARISATSWSPFCALALLPEIFWKLRIASLVSVPKLPSTRPGSTEPYFFG